MTKNNHLYETIDKKLRALNPDYIPPDLEPSLLETLFQLTKTHPLKEPAGGIPFEEAIKKLTQPDLTAGKTTLGDQPSPQLVQALNDLREKVYAGPLNKSPEREI